MPAVKNLIGIAGRCGLIQMILFLHRIPLNPFRSVFVDKTGNSVIIEGDEVIYKQRNYQVVTNYLQNHPELGGYPCWRHETATSMLNNLTDITFEKLKISVRQFM